MSSYFIDWDNLLSVINVNVTLTDVLAVWAAFIATGVLLWDVHKWRTSGPQIHFDVKTNMLMYGDSAIPEDEKQIVCTVTNRGDRLTTINILGVYSYENSFKKLLGKTKQNGMIKNPGSISGNPLPFVLEPGKEWVGLAKQEGISELCGENTICEMAVFCSHRNKPIKKVVRFPKEKD